MSDKKLRTLREKARARGHWALDAAVCVALEAPESLDAQLNVVGAMIEVGTLANSVEPWTKQWRAPAEARWVERCLARLLTVGADHDAWALSALLGASLDALRTALKVAKPTTMGVFRGGPVRGEKLHVGLFAGQVQDLGGEFPTWGPVLELAWSTKSGLLVDVGRCRAVLPTASGRTAAGTWVQGTGVLALRSQALATQRLASVELDYPADALVAPREARLA